MSFTREYFEMCRGRRGDRRCWQCEWFGHIGDVGNVDGLGTWPGTADMRR